MKDMTEQNKTEPSKTAPWTPPEPEEAEPIDDIYIRTEAELEDAVEQLGFLPLFAGDVPGFSVEEMTDPAAWWTDDPETDPWDWRITASSSGRLVYGKFFHGRAGFISKEWLPVFANYRRDGYDFDSRWDDELATYRQKKIMDLFMEEHAQAELFSFEVKKGAGFGKDGEKNFEGTLTQLEMMCYLVDCCFKHRVTKDGREYGWSIAVLSTPEHLFSYDYVTADYKEDPKESLKRIALRVLTLCPEAEASSIMKLIARPDDQVRENRKHLPYPQNLLKAIDKKTDPYVWSKDQVDGLYVAIGQLRPKQQRMLRMKYVEGKSNAEIGAVMNRAAGTIGSYHGKAMYMLRTPLIAAWYRNGYRENLKACAAGEGWTFDVPEPEEKVSDQDLVLRLGIKVNVYESLVSHGIVTIGDLLQAAADPGWYKSIRGVGPKTAEDIMNKLSEHYLMEQKIS